MEFRWNDWNIEHVAAHGVDPDEAEMVIKGAKSPYPARYPDSKYLVWGRGRGGRFLQVIYVLDPDDTLFVIHARPLTEREKKWLRRKMK